MPKGFEITSSEIDGIGDMWRFDRFDLKVLIRRDPEYIKSILHLSDPIAFKEFLSLM